MNSERGGAEVGIEAMIGKRDSQSNSELVDRNRQQTRDSRVLATQHIHAYTI